MFLSHIKQYPSLNLPYLQRREEGEETLSPSAPPPQPTVSLDHSRSQLSTFIWHLYERQQSTLAMHIMHREQNDPFPRNARRPHRLGGRQRQRRRPYRTTPKARVFVPDKTIPGEHNISQQLLDEISSTSLLDTNRPNSYSDFHITPHVSLLCIFTLTISSTFQRIIVILMLPHSHFEMSQINL